MKSKSHHALILRAYQSNGVVQPSVVREGPVSALVGNDPHSSRHSSLQKRVVEWRGKKEVVIREKALV
jgi:hypothetical protein